MIHIEIIDERNAAYPRVYATMIITRTSLTKWRVAYSTDDLEHSNSFTLKVPEDQEQTERIANLAFRKLVDMGFGHPCGKA